MALASMKQLVFIVVCLSAISCYRIIEPKNAEVSETEAMYSEPYCNEIEGMTQTGVGRQIIFENVSFSRDAAWIRDVQYFAVPECILTCDDYKPDLIGGRTLRFNLRYKESNDEARISVFKIQDYKNAFARYPQYVENRDAELRSLLGDSTPLSTYGENPPPHVTWMDAHQTFYAKGAKVDFTNGAGLLTVTDISQDGFVTISNLRLRFFFQGFTTNGEYFVEMDFPTKLKGLPDKEEEFRSGVGSGWKVYDSPEHLAAYKGYILKTAAKIDNARSADFRPSLSEVETFIRAFEIKTVQNARD